MPQMYPMNWIILFTIFSATFLIFMTQVYFNFKWNIPLKTYKNLSNSKKINWNKFW